MPTFFLDYENGNDNWGGTSFNVLASGTNGRISAPPQTAYSTFSAATANFPNDGSLASTKNLAWYSDWMYGNTGNNNSSTAVSNTTPPSGIDSKIYTITENTVNNTHNLVSTAWNTPWYGQTEYTISFYAKSNGRNKFILRVGSDARSARFNVGNGTVEETGAGLTSAISSIGNGWYRVSVTVTTSGTLGQYTTESWEVYLLQDSFSSLVATSSGYSGDGTSGIYLCGMQIEAAASVTSYEKPPLHILSIFNGSSYMQFYITERISSTSLRINLISGGTAISTQSVDRQYFIGGRLQTITNGLTAARTIAGDDIRIMASPDPTLVGNATFSGNKGDITRNVSASTNATPISITTTSTHGYVTGDTIVITGHTTNTNANGTWTVTVTGTTTFTLDGSTGNGVGGATGTVRRITNGVVRLSSSVTENIASFGNRGTGRTAWTAVAGGNATASFDTTDTKEGDVSDSLSVTAGFTTGKVAYKATGTLNLSGYQQISFWIKQTAGTTTVAGDISLRLCSDTIGDTTVHTINIPAIVLNSRWVPFTVDLNTNLNNSIQSVALYIDTDRGAQTFLISNIIACKARSSADSLNLQSLIGKNTSSEKWWGGIQSINGTRVILDVDVTYTPISAANNTGGINAVYRGYHGTSATTSLFKRETIKTPMTTVQTGPAQNYTGDSGVESNLLVSLQFGFDRTNMSSRTGESFFDGLNGYGHGLSTTSRNFISYSNAGFVRYHHGFYFQSCTGSIVNSIWCVNNSNIAFYPYAVYLCSISNIYIFFNNTWGVFGNVASQRNTFNNVQILNGGGGFNLSYCSNNTILNCISQNNNSSNFSLGHGIRNLFKNCSAIDGNGFGIAITDSAEDNVFLSCTTTNNSIASVQSAPHGTNYIRNCILNETTEVSSALSYSDGRTIFINNDNSTNNYFIYTDGGTLYNTASVRYSNSGFSWALAPTSTSIRSSTYPLALSIAKVAVNANSLVTVKAWMRRTSTTLVTGLRIKADQIAGVSNDITSYMTAVADTWEQVTLNFTPTETGVVEILAECWGGTTFTAYVDDISITQV